MKKSILASAYLVTLCFSISIEAQPDRTYSAGGKMVVYFNTPVDNTVSSGVNAIYLNGKMADTLAAYISRAKYTIDIAQYNYSTSTTTAPITAAINAAYTRGVHVRWIYDGSQTNAELANVNIGTNHKLASPTGTPYGIMHNKFMIIDASSTNHNDPIVWTGSPDWSGQQFNTCQNNVIIIQDYAFAQAHLAQFNMMWGGPGLTPVTANEKFGPNKTASTGPSTFVIGGRTVELYFSPMDGTNSHILTSIASANTDLYFGVYTFTQNTNATNIVAKKNAGVYVAGIVDQYSNGTTPTAYNTLTAGLGSKLITYANSTYVYHNKYMIVDPNNFCSDPQVTTGSYNWTSAADTKNDENMIIIHNDTIANIYYQAFHQNFTDLLGTLTTPANCASIGITIAASPAGAICTGNSVTFTATPTGGGTPSYQWKVNGTNIGTNSATYTTSNLTNGQIVTCVLTSGANTATSNAVTMVVNGTLVPSVTIAVTSGTNPACTGASLTFTATPVNGGTTPTYQWKVNGTNSGTNSATYTSSTLANNAVITCVMTSSSSCASPATATSTGVTVTINANPQVPTITVTGNTLTSSASSGNQWYLNAAIINGAVNPAYTAAANGSYTVVVTNSFGCSSTSSATTVFTTGISTVENNAVLNVFPNPSDGIVTLNFAGSNRHISIEVINDLGKLVYTQMINGCTNDCNKIIDMSAFKKGIYLFRISTDGNIQTKKIMLLK